MSELEDKLNSLLSNQDAMAQVMQLAQSLSQSGVGAADSGSAAPPVSYTHLTLPTNREV